MPALSPTTNRTMAVFEIFAREKRALSNSDMARLLSVADSSCTDLLHTLHVLGYLIRTPKTRRFYPSGRLYETARQIAENDPLTSVAQEAVDQLVEKTNESAYFGVMQATTVKIVAAQQSRHPLRYIIDVGSRLPLHASSLGKAMLGLLHANELPDTVEALSMQRYTPDTVVDGKRLIDEVERGRVLGCYEGRSEAAEGVAGLAVSGWLSGLPVGISLGGPIDRIDRNRDKYIEALHEVRNTLLSDS